MATQTEMVVRGRCGCGRKLRIRNAQAGSQITCPSCGRLIALTAADVARGTIKVDFIYVEPEQDTRDPDAMLEAIPVSAGAEVRVALEGARPGVTERVVYTNEDGALRGAMSGRTGTLPGSAYFGMATSSGPMRVRSFGADLIASFYFAGVSRNALNIVVTALVMCLLMGVIAILPASRLAIIPLFGVVCAYAMHFNFLVFDTTVAGEDEVPWYETNWDFWEDVISPVFRLGMVSLLCTLPAMLLAYITRLSGPGDLVAYAVVLAAGWLFWPIGVMTITLGNSILCFRPGVLLRSILAIGPRYLLAYGLCIAVMAGWVAFVLIVPPPTLGTLPTALFNIAKALIAPVLNLYLGYVLFRTLGLLYRHFHTRLPWRA